MTIDTLAFAAIAAGCFTAGLLLTLSIHSIRNEERDR